MTLKQWLRATPDGFTLRGRDGPQQHTYMYECNRCHAIIGANDEAYVQHVKDHETTDLVIDRLSDPQHRRLDRAFANLRKAHDRSR